MGFRNVRLNEVELAEIEEALTRLSRAPSVVGQAARSGALKRLADRMAIEKGCAQRGAPDIPEQVLGVFQDYFAANAPRNAPWAGSARWEALGRVWVELIRKTGGG